MLRRMTRFVETRARSLGADVVLAMGWYPLPSDSVQFAYWGDATVAQRLDLAPYWSGVSERTRRRTPMVEGRILRGLPVAMSSHWAAKDAQERYGVIARVIPFGANIDDPGVLERKRSQTLRALTVGVEWYRKGIDRAVTIIDEARRDGLDVILDVAGVLPPSDEWRRPYVQWHGRLAKESLADLYRRCDVFLLPTRNDPSPVVLTEASAFGLPCVASRTGGISDRLEDSVNGRLVKSDPFDARLWAHALGDVAEHYDAMSHAARERFERDGRWSVHAETVVRWLHQVM